MVRVLQMIFLDTLEGEKSLRNMLLTQLKVNQILIVASSLLFIKYYKKKFTTIYTSSPIIVQSSVEFQPAKPLLILCGDTKNNIGGIS